jgi:hypothetical protein
LNRSFIRIRLGNSPHGDREPWRRSERFAFQALDTSTQWLRSLGPATAARRLQTEMQQINGPETAADIIEGTLKIRQLHKAAS